MVESLRLVFFKIDRSTQKLTTGGIHYSMFDVGRSTFISFSFDLTGRSRPAAGLKPLIYKARVNIANKLLM
jgi:hypothetical protein